MKIELRDGKLLVEMTVKEANFVASALDDYESSSAPRSFSEMGVCVEFDKFLDENKLR